MAEAALSRFLVDSTDLFNAAEPLGETRTLAKVAS
jgi:hypothetical protein